jgi:putative ABC transport system permease protein
MDVLVSFFSSIPAACAQGIIWGIMAIGVYITYKILDIADLTVDGSICTGAAVCAVMIVNGQPMWLALLASVLAGMFTGLVTGIFHTFMGIPAILAGILTQLILWSVNLKIMGAANTGLPSRKFDLLISRGDLFKSLIILEIVAIALIALLYLFFGTEFGSSIRATGANLNMSRAQGINTKMTKIFGLVLSNGVVALAGALLAQFSGSASVTMGSGAIVIGLAAVVVGEALFGWMARNNFAIKLFTVVLGAISYYIIYQTVIYLGLDPDYLKMLAAVIVAIFLTVPYLKENLTIFSVGKKNQNKNKKGAA